MRPHSSRGRTSTARRNACQASPPVKNSARVRSSGRCSTSAPRISESSRTHPARTSYRYSVIQWSRAWPGWKYVAKPHRTRASTPTRRNSATADHREVPTRAHDAFRWDARCREIRSIQGEQSLQQLVHRTDLVLLEPVVREVELLSFAWLDDEATDGTSHLNWTALKGLETVTGASSSSIPPVKTYPAASLNSWMTTWRHGQPRPSPLRGISSCQCRGRGELWHFVFARPGDHRPASVPRTSPVLVDIGLRPRSQPRRPLRGPDGSHHWRNGLRRR
jgi:hypothetical protein